MTPRPEIFVTFQTPNTTPHAQSSFLQQNLHKPKPLYQYQIKIYLFNSIHIQAFAEITHKQQMQMERIIFQLVLFFTGKL